MIGTIPANNVCAVPPATTVALPSVAAAPLVLMTGKGVVGPQEKSWAFHPAQPWQAADYTLAVDGNLEDVAGNTPLRPFDVDLKVTPPPSQKLKISFYPAAK